MNYVDLILLLPLAYGLIRGLFKGLVHELASLAAIILGIFLAYHYSDEVAVFFSQQLNETGTWVNILAYVAVFLSVAIVLHILAFSLTKMLKMLSLGLVNRLLGGAFGLIKMLLVLLLLIFLLNPFLTELRQKNSSWQNSRVYTELQEYSPLAGEMLTRFKDTSNRETF